MELGNFNNIEKDLSQNDINNIPEKNTDIINTPDAIETEKTIETQTESINENINNIDESVDNQKDIVNESAETNNSSAAASSNTSDNIQESNQDEIIIKQIEKVLMSDGLSDIYESLNDKEKEKFNKEKEKATVKIKEALENVSKNIKKTVHTILKAITKFINSIKGINNTAYKEKLIKMKVEKILDENEETRHLNDF